MRSNFLKELFHFLKKNPGMAVILTLPLIFGLIFGQNLALIAIPYLVFFSFWTYFYHKLQNPPKP